MIITDVVVGAGAGGREVVVGTGIELTDDVCAMLDEEVTAADVVAGKTTALEEEEAGSTTATLEDEVGCTGATEDEGVTVTPPKLAQANPIFVTAAPLLLGLLRSHAACT